MGDVVRRLTSKNYCKHIDNTLTEHFNGTSWQVVAIPSPNTADGLSDVAAGGGVVWAVGDTAPANTTATQTLAELYP